MNYSHQKQRKANKKKQTEKTNKSQWTCPHLLGKAESGDTWYALLSHSERLEYPLSAVESSWELF